MSVRKSNDDAGVISARLIETSRALCADLEPLRFGAPVSVTYNPLAYGRRAHEEYLTRFATRRGVCVLLGMNPGPWGMAQTAVPFGAVSWVRDWMKVGAIASAPPIEHPKRPVLGFDCPRTEVSGDRLWGWASARFGEPDAFFARFFVWNYCPLSFMVTSGANLIPEKLPAAEREPLFEICDRALAEVASILLPSVVVGVGAFAATRARRALPETVSVGQILHPSPASPAANRGWAPVVEKQLTELGLSLDRGPDV